MKKIIESLKNVINLIELDDAVKKFFDYESHYYFKEDKSQTVMEVIDLRKGYVSLSSHNNSHCTAGDPEYIMRNVNKS